jgi:hypothetical protein
MSAMGQKQTYDRVIEFVPLVPRGDVKLADANVCLRAKWHKLSAVDNQGWAVHFPKSESDESRVDTPAVTLPVSNDMTALHVLSASLFPVP